MLFEEREKRAFLKKEGRRIENLIEGYDQKYGGHKYLENTDAAQVDVAQLHGTKHLFLEEMLIQKGVASQGRIGSGGDPKLLGSANVSLLNEHKEYQHKQKELQNRRIEKLLTPRQSNPALQEFLQT